MGWQRLLTIGCAILAIVAPLGCAQSPPRAQRTMFKGVELYSWSDTASGQCRYSLLPGTNRNKEPAEIMASDTAIPDIPRLKERLALLADGEQVFRALRKTPSAQSCPSRAEIDDIVGYAAAHKVTITVR